MKRTTSKPSVTRCIAYVRVSLQKQADEGVSLDAQRAKLEAYASLYDLQIVDVLVDAGQSAKTLDRPGLQKALGMLDSGEADALLVVKLDRLTRSVRDLGALIDTYFAPGKSALLSVSEQIDTRSAGGRLVLNVLASVSQWERESTAERTSAAMQHMRSEKLYTGGRCRFGYSVGADGSLVENAEEQATIAMARAHRAAGKSLREVVKALEAAGARTRMGKPFALAGVHDLLADAA